MASQAQPSCLIIGGGITGLVAGTQLQNADVAVTILDKGRGIGGRFATRRLAHPNGGEGQFDYGMQRFEVSDRRFQVWVEQWVAEDVVVPWPETSARSAITYYRGRLSNRSIAKHLAQTLTVHTQTRVTAIRYQGDRWLAQTSQNQHFAAQSLLLTMPMPQVLELFNTSVIALPSDLKDDLEAIAYDPCIGVLALLAGPSQIPEAGLQCQDEALAWLACNHKKGISTIPAATLHATPEFSRTYWDAPEGDIAQHLLDAAVPWLGSPVVDYSIHRWQYSQPQTVYGDRYLSVPAPAPLVIAGDAFAPTLPARPTLNLENSVLSGLAAATYLLEQI